MCVSFKEVFSGPSIEVNSNWICVVAIKSIFKIRESDLYFIWLDSIRNSFESFGFLEMNIWNCWYRFSCLISLLYFIMKSLDSLKIICSISQNKSSSIIRNWHDEFLREIFDKWLIEPQLFLSLVISMYPFWL